MPAVGSYHSMTPVPAREPKHYAFNFLFGLLHRGEFREFAQKLGTTPNIFVPKSLHDKYLWRTPAQLRQRRRISICEHLGTQENAVPAIIYQNRGRFPGKQVLKA